MMMPDGFIPRSPFSKDIIELSLKVMAIYRGTLLQRYVDHGLTSSSWIRPASLAGLLMRISRRSSSQRKHVPNPHPFGTDGTNLT